VSIRVRPRARRDIDGGFNHYLDEAGAEVALRFADDVELSLRLLARQPRLGSHRHAALLRWPAIRSWPLRPRPYIVLYQQHGDHLDIVRVLHTARDISASLTEPDATP
jgi:toxin ParE1/3/4